MSDSTVLFDYSKQIKLGVGVIVVCVFGFLFWASIAPIASASMSQGRVVAETSVKSVEHFEGGIIHKLNVKEGDFVEKGDIVVELAKDQAESRLNQLKTREVSDAARLARLTAEQGFSKTITLPTWLQELAESDEFARLQVDQQGKLFDQRRISLLNKVGIYKQQKLQLKEKITGLANEKEELIHSLDIIAEQLGMYRKLVESGNLPKIQEMELERRESQLKGSFHQRNGQLAVAKQQLLEVDLKVEHEKKQFLKEIHEQLDSVRQALAETQNALYSASDILSRINIVSPVSGYVVTIHEGTLGGVVKSGEPIFDVLPKEDLLIIEALAGAQDINVLKLGQPAKVRLTAYNFRELSPLDAELVYISADIIDDRQKEVTGYRIKLKLKEGQIPDFVEVYPGMSAEVMVLTGSRTLIQYLTDPLFEMFYKAFRES